MEKSIIRNLACCKDKVAPQFGCNDNYYKKKYRKPGKYKKYKLIRTVILNKQELKYRQERLQYNIYAGVCEKSILAQRKTIFKLQHEIQRIEYKLKHNLR